MPPLPKLTSLSNALTRAKRLVSDSVQLGLECIGLFVSASGATVAVFIGKLFLSIILGFIALGFVLRLSGRRTSRREVQPPAVPAWGAVACAFLAAIETALLVEATNLPVRADQANFEQHNWLLVGLAFVVLYFLQLRVVRVALAGRGVVPRS